MVEKSIAQEDIGPSGKDAAVVLLNGHGVVIKLLSTYLYLFPYSRIAVNFGQRCFFLQLTVVTVETYTD